MLKMWASHPIRVRGLKFVHKRNYCRENNVAPYTGAWIEIRWPWPLAEQASMVAPYTGAWIEIINRLGNLGSLHVAPYTGAWIEMEVLYYLVSHILGSHPIRVRGLKYFWWWQFSFKQIVAPYTGARIEISIART